jgi:peptidoglycan/LPS O-acetylase OafA/YrhL
VAGINFVLASIPAIGHIGVNLFLVISGFCLAYPFVRDPTYLQRMSLRKFCLRRVSRIVPAYYASFLVVAAVSLLASKLLPDRRHMVLSNPLDYILHALCLHNFSVDHVSSINGSYWSLALEFQLYFAFPLLLALMFRFGIWPILAITVVV